MTSVLFGLFLVAFFSIMNVIASITDFIVQTALDGYDRIRRVLVRSDDSLDRDESSDLVSSMTETEVMADLDCSKEQAERILKLAHAGFLHGLKSKGLFGPNKDYVLQEIEELEQELDSYDHHVLGIYTVMYNRGVSKSEHTSEVGSPIWY